MKQINIVFTGGLNLVVGRSCPLIERKFCLCTILQL